MDREPILLGLLPAPYLRGAPSRAPLLRAYLSPCHGRGLKSPVCRGTADEGRDGDHFLDHMDVRLVLLGYHLLGVLSV